MKQVEEKIVKTLAKMNQKVSMPVVFFSVVFSIQFVLLLLLYTLFSSFFLHFLSGSTLVTIVMLSYFIYLPLDGNSKTTWMVLIILSPLLGTFFYWFVQWDFGHRALKKELRNMIRLSKGNILPPHSIYQPAILPYLQRSNDVYAYEKNKVSYLSSGEQYWETLLEALTEAKDFIFMEYFILARGEMWNAILTILKEKARQGVEVRVMYDGTCEFTTLPFGYVEELKAFGIEAKVFSPIRPFISTHYNYRDHRKITVIDGKVAFTGGVNIADEYVNKLDKYGHWKDTGLKMEGSSVDGWTLLFLQLWSLGKEQPDFSRYLNRPYSVFEEEGCIIPYGDSPLDEDKAGKRVYIQLLNEARNYVHIMTPYLILDEEFIQALTFASERGVDVSIILPGRPDKITPYALAKTHYRTLLQSGIKLYEYTPGFIHAKSFVSDDKKAVVGTINLDYRSLYHHFECAAYLEGHSCIPLIEEDFQQTRALCQPVTLLSESTQSIPLKLIGYVMKIMAPLM